MVFFVFFGVLLTKQLRQEGAREKAAKERKQEAVPLLSAVCRLEQPVLSCEYSHWPPVALRRWRSPLPGWAVKPPYVEKKKTEEERGQEEVERSKCDDQKSWTNEVHCLQSLLYTWSAVSCMWQFYVGGVRLALSLWNSRWRWIWIWNYRWE